MTEIGSSRLNNQNLAYALRIFGRPPRTTACDCERAMEPALPQTLFRMTDHDLLQKMNGADQPRRHVLLKDKNKTDEAVFEELFLATLSRMPDAKTRSRRSRNTERNQATGPRRSPTSCGRW